MSRTHSPYGCEPGQVFNYFTLKEMVFEGSRRYWWCECKCGKMVKNREDRVAKGVVKSCGCRKHDMVGDKNPLWKGCGELHGGTYASIRAQAGYRNIAFEVSIEYIWDLFQKQGGRCALTGVPLNFESMNNRLNGAEQTASLDRINSNLPYVEGNVWWIHKDVNRMKREYPMERFLEVCSLVNSYYLSKNPLSPAPDKAADPAPDMQTAA